jgi:V-type H+-transporting ATPase subunit d
MSEGLFFNVTTGYIEGVVRGYRNTLLTGQQYGNLAQCETIDGMLSSVSPCSTMTPG